MTHTWTVSLRGTTLPSPNARMHWPQRHRLTAAALTLSKMVSASERHRLRLPVATERRHVSITMLRTPRQGLMDGDNLQAMLKPIRDGLTVRLGSGWIVDDRPAWATFEYHQRIDRTHGPACEITVIL